MRVQISSLAMRFYVHDGWTKDVLESYLTGGSLVEKRYSGHHDHYFILDVGSGLDVDRMFNDGLVSDEDVIPFDKWDEKDKRALMKSRNW